MELSVIIVNYNVRHFLEQCLHSVKKASEKTECEIFVVDNNSADGSCSMVRSQFPEVRLIRNPVNAGFASANNQAIRLASGRFILLLNPDTLVEEDTFSKCLEFMEAHQETGALGVKMINGDGRLLPESKRSLPTPGTAFYKLSGLSFLFPGSKTFNRYYLGHIDHSSTSEAEIISGAFMFLRREALDKTGLLDEEFFMYGEDIDLSYRILKAGYKNYYFPEVKIIHYKGESTKKGDLNYVIHFYKAMLIFVRKHYKSGGFRSLKLIIQVAIYLLGLIDILKNLLKKIFLPLADAVLLFGTYKFVIPIWENYRFGGSYSYPEIFPGIIVPFYTAVTILFIFLTGGYKLPSVLKNSIKGIVFAAIGIIAIYSLLPLEYRFSRAVILLGALSALTIIPIYRLILSVTGMGLVVNPIVKTHRTIIVGDIEGYQVIRNLINNSGNDSKVIGRVSSSQDDNGSDVLGNLDQIKEIIRISHVTEIIFSTRELTASQIINSMNMVSDCNVKIKIAPQGERLIIGSKSIYQQGDNFPSGDSFFRFTSLIRRKNKKQ